MDSYEATKVVFTRIQALDPENASKIMGFIFIQDPCEKEMVRLAYGPETVLVSLINQAKSHLGISSNASYSPSSSSGFHRRSFSVDDVYAAGEEEGGAGGFGWRPCVYYAKGFCKNGGNCKFSHGVGQFGEFSENGGVFVGSPSNNADGFDEFLRVKALQQQQRVSQLMGFNKGVGFMNNNSSINNDSPRIKAIQQLQRISQLMGFNKGVGFMNNNSNSNNDSPREYDNMESPSNTMGFNKGISFMNHNNNDSPRSAAAALVMGEELHKFGRCRSERTDFSAMGLGGADSTARQIYLTFPADSTFKEEDVSNYFCKFGPVQDVRIPYQQKRMFGFVTFLYPGTVKTILAKGNPHFVCDSRVLVKPYKEKGKIPEKRQHQFGGGDFAACLSPTGSESLDSYDFPIGPRMLLNNQEMLRRKLEQAEYQQAIELQGRRLMNLQLMDLKNHQHHHQQHAHQYHPSISSPVFSHLQNNPSFLLRAENNSNLEILEDTGDSLVVDQQHDELDEIKGFLVNSNADANGNSEDFFNPDHNDLHECLEHRLPDNLFASPTRSSAENGSVFFSTLSEADNSSSVVATPSSNITSPSPESRYFPGQEIKFGRHVN